MPNPSNSDLVGEASATYSEQHPHEPEIPPALDSEGRCLVCGLLVERAELAQQLEQAEQRDAWMRKQLDRLIESAEAVVAATGLATARAVLGDLRDARAALTPDEGAE